MEGRSVIGSGNQVLPEEELPRLLEQMASRLVPGFDREEDGAGRIQLRTLSDLQSACQAHRSHSISISWPVSPSTGFLGGEEERSRSQMLAGPLKDAELSHFHFYSQPLGRSIPAVGREMDFDSFKTWSGRLDGRMADLRARQLPIELQEDVADRAAPPVQRYFDALEGPELDILKPSEEAVLREDKPWPLLLRFPVSSFGMCMGMGSQSILWKTLASSPSTAFLRVSPEVNFLLWCASLLLMAAISATYALKAVFYFEAVRREFHHPVRVNFFFAPWIALLFLFLGLPKSFPLELHGGAVWYVLMAPILCLELKIYGQWMSGGQRRLSKVANPSNHLSIVGNFVGALLGASLGLREGPIFFFAVGLAHYAVLFVTLYQRLPTNETLPKELHPVFFLFVASPSVASVAWARINGGFDFASRIVYFIALFLYASLAVRVNFFRGFRFSLAWWAYTFPMTMSAIATIRYAAEVRNPFTQSLSIALSAVSTGMVALVLVSTGLHAFVQRDLFPNDISIAITKSPPRVSKNALRPAPAEEKDEDVFTQDIES